MPSTAPAPPGRRPSSPVKPSRPSASASAPACWPPGSPPAAPPVQLLARGSETRPTPWAAFGVAGVLMAAAGLLLAYGPKLPPGVAWHVYLGALLLVLGGSLAAVALLPLLGLPGLRSRRWALRLSL